MDILNTRLTRLDDEFGQQGFTVFEQQDGSQPVQSAEWLTPQSRPPLSVYLARRGSGSQRYYKISPGYRGTNFDTYLIPEFRNKSIIEDDFEMILTPDDRVYLTITAKSEAKSYLSYVSNPANPSEYITVSVPYPTGKVNFLNCEIVVRKSPPPLGPIIPVGTQGTAYVFLAIINPDGSVSTILPP